MIKSPLTSPLRPALTSPYELITRSVFELNGTQWGEFSKLLVLNSSFEIEVTVSGIPEGTSSVAKVMFSILQANSSGKNIHIGRRNGDILTFAFYSSDINVDLAGLIDWNKVNTFNCKYDHSTGEKVVFLNGSEVAREVQPKLTIDWLLPTSTYFMKRLGDNNGITPGTLFSTKIWANGDSTTGNLILNIPFDEYGTGYQRDLTSTITDINDPNWRGVILQNALPEHWMQIERKRWWDYWLGVENLVSNGQFSDGVLEWTISSGMTKELEGTSGRFMLNDLNAARDVYQGDKIQVGQSVLASCRVVDIQGELALVAGYTGAGISPRFSSVGRFTETLVATGNGSLGFRLYATPTDIASVLVDDLIFRRKLEIAQ